jgi:MSHA pilin protein MshD
LSSARGATLIELVIAIVIFAVAGAAIASLYTGTTKSSADPQIRAQGRSIAEAYMDEILLQRYCENPDDPTPCDDTVPGGEDDDGGDEGESRSEFDDVFDYKDLDPNPQTPTDQNGDEITQLTDYSVEVTVANDPQAEETAEITVIVTHDVSDKLNYSVVSERELY